jgi:alkanesulfonate monooxygenase SsuD/methylene tetrahydromethanopterin reductase-like flavin-dependent oxidoreductase (luciferase family)
MLLDSRIGSSIVGSPETVKTKLQQFLDETQADEMIINAQIFDHKARLKSFEIVADVFKG